MLNALLIIVLVLLIIGGLPHWPFMAERGYGYYPSGGLTLLLVIIVVLIVAGRL